jgi:hypothetical protein
MPRWNDESLRVYKENSQIVILARKYSEKHWYKCDANEEHTKIYNLCKYAIFNDQLTIKQAGWLKAYLRRNNVDESELSSTQIALMSTNSAQQ